MLDKATVIKEAQKYASKGQIDKAVATWEDYLKSSRDGAGFNAVGDLYLKKNDKKNAIEAYHKASRIFRDEGFALKALALYKKILNINNQDADSLLALGELNEDKSIIQDAIKYYLAAADIFAKENKRDKLLDAFEKIVRLAPNNVPLRMKILEMLTREGFVTEAAKEYMSIGKMFHEKKDFAKAQEFYKKALEIQPHNRMALLALSEASEQSGKADDAIGYLDRIIEGTGEDTDLLMRLGRLYVAKKEYDKASEYVMRIIETEPANLDAKKLLGDICIKRGEMECAWKEYSAVIDEMIFKEQFDEAVKLLNMFKKLDPVESGKKLVQLHKQRENLEGAFDELSGLCKIFDDKGMMEDAVKACQEALSIKPEDTGIKQILYGLEKKMGVEEQPPVEAQKSVAELLTEVDIFLRYGLHGEAQSLLEKLEEREPANVEIHERLMMLYRDMGNKEGAVTEALVIADFHASKGNEELKKAILNKAYEISPGDERFHARPDFVPPERAHKAAAPIAERPQIEAGPNIEEYAEDLAEAGFYLKQELFAEALKIYEKLLKIFPLNEKVQKGVEASRIAIKKQEDDALAKAAAEAEAAKAEAEHMETLSLDDFMAEEPVAEKEPELDSEVLEIFEEFKKGMAQDVTAEDYDSHYNLGIAYKEMGLLDDAITALRMAAKSPQYFVQSMSTLGICFMSKGKFGEAADAFTSALMKTTEGDESFWGLKYELAEAYMKSGNIKGAIELFGEVQKWNPDFRETRQRLQELMGPAVAASREAPAQAAQPKAQPQPEPPLAGPENQKGKKSRVSYI